MSIDITRISSVLAKHFSKQELLEFASSIYPLHRIQGSLDLEKSINVVASFLKKAGLPFVIHEYSYLRRYGLMPPIVGWDAYFGEARLVKPMEEILSSFLQSKTAIVAHSPSGDVEAEVVYVANADHLDKVDVNEKIVLTSASPRSIYFKGIARGAKAFLFFKKSAPSEAVPYLGLFLKPNEVEKAKAPAMSIPRRYAQKIIDFLERGSKVVARVKVEASYRFDAKIRVVEAWIGEGKSEVHAVAHICHPGGTVNDNVSGCATLFELAVAIKRAIDRGDLEEPKEGKAVFVWLPEYSGTVPYLEELLKSSRNVAFSIDLDMVGEKQDVTGSTLVFIRSPSILRSPIEAILYALLLKELRGAKTFGDVASLLDYRFDVSPYLSGSDHDIYLKFGVPAVMINQWPDRYYHTDLDTIDKLDPEICKRVGIAVATTMYLFAKLGEEKLTKEFENIVSGYESFVKGIKLVSLIEKVSSNGKGLEIPKVKYVCRCLGLPGRRYLEEVLSEEDLKRVEKIVEEGGIYANLFFAYIPIVLSRRAMSAEELINVIEEEYGVVDKGKVLELVELLEKAKVIERVE